MVKNDKIDAITLCGGALCIDFINTVKNRVTQPMSDYLTGLSDLLYWAVRMDLISIAQYDNMLAQTEEYPNERKLFFEKALMFRELLYKIFQQIVAGEKVQEELLSRCNSFFSEYFSLLNVKQQGDGFSEFWKIEPHSLTSVLAPVVYDGYKFLLSDKLNKLKECPKCKWLFLDTTKNGKRRWCTMKTCGSSVKALEWYHRKKEIK